MEQSLKKIQRHNGKMIKKEKAKQKVLGNKNNQLMCTCIKMV